MSIRRTSVPPPGSGTRSSVNELSLSAAAGCWLSALPLSSPPLDLLLELEHALDAGQIQPELGGHALDAAQALDIRL
jgi:hypothetical protein